MRSIRATAVLGEAPVKSMASIESSISRRPTSAASSFEGVLSGVLAIAAREPVIARNPAVGVTLPAKRRKSPRYPTHSQAAALSSSAAQEQPARSPSHPTS